MRVCICPWIEHRLLKKLTRGEIIAGYRVITIEHSTKSVTAITSSSPGILFQQALYPI